MIIKPMEILHVRHDRNHMATTFELVVSCEPARSQLADRLLAQAHAEIASLELELSEFHPESPVHRLNHAATDERVPVPASVLELLERSSSLRERTAGRFDPEAKSDAPVLGTRRVHWDARQGVAWRSDARARLSFGAIGKGYALDRVRLLLEQAGFHDFLLTAGGSSIVISGFAAPGDPWRWGWSWRKDAQGIPLGIPLTHASGHAIAIGVSGTHEKGEHIVYAGYRPASAPPLKSALVAHASAADADALSTALFVGGWESSGSIESASTAASALACVGDDEHLRWNAAFQTIWGSLDRFSRRGSSVGKALLLALSLAIGLAAPTLPVRADDAAASAAPAAAPTSATEETAAPASETASATSEPSAEESLDLDALGGASFTPYVTERKPLWALAPAAMILFVLLHLKKPKKTGRNNG